MVQYKMKRMVPVRLPSLTLQRRSDGGYCCCDCQRCYEGCGRCLTHWWFCTICCSFVLVSSFPRFCALLDVVFTTFIYLVSVRPSNQSISEFLDSEYNHYSFSKSAIDLVLISLFRSVILFFCFAYRYQRDGYSQPILVATSVALISSFFVIVKLVAIKHVSSMLGLLLFSLIYVWCAFVLFLCVRRRKIRMRPLATIHNPVGIKVDYETSYQTINSSHNYVKGPSESSDEESVPSSSQLRPTHTRARTGSHDSRSDYPLLKDRPVLTEHIVLESPADPVQIREPMLAGSGAPGVRSGSGMGDIRAVGVPVAEFSKAEQALVEPDSQFVALEGVNVHYRVIRREGFAEEKSVGEPTCVVFLHGFGGGVFSWRRVIPDLAGHCDIMVAFDRPGFGLTEKPLDNLQDSPNPYSAEFSVRLTLRLMDSLGIQRAVLVGHSTGAALACMCALRAPKRVSGLVLVALTQGLPKFIRSILKTKLGGPIIMRLVKSEIGDVAIRRAWHDPDAIPSEVVTAHKQCLKVKNWGKALLEMARVSRTRLLQDREFSSILCPVLLIHGDDDRLVTFSESQRLARQLKNSEIVKIEQCGHIPHAERPSEFVDELTHFLSRVRAFRASDQHVVRPMLEVRGEEEKCPERFPAVEIQQVSLSKKKK
eukprot:52517_1